MLTKEIKLNKYVVTILLLFYVITIGLYASYAYYELSVIKNGVVVIQTATIDITTNVVDQENNTFTIPANSNITVTVNLTTELTNEIGYKMYYEVISGISTFNATSTTNFTNDIVEANMTSSTQLQFTFTNLGSNDITIKLGTKGGLANYPIPLDEGIELKVNTTLGVPAKDAIVESVNNPSGSCKTKVEEDGITYISGTSTCINFNYVWYSGKLWRITAIYPDGTMKMITDSNITTINWGSKSTVSSSDLTSAYSTSWMREWLNQEFLPTLYNYENIIVTDAGWYSIADSVSTPTKPTGDYTITDPVGLLNAYEYYMSYKNTSYSNGYLNIGYYWWLITPYNSSSVRYVLNYGNLSRDDPSSRTGSGARPSVNLQSTIQLTAGSGTATDPYRIKGDQEEAEENVTLINTRQSGEYVKLSSDETAPTFRIVDTELVGENLTTKIVLNDYVKDTNDVDADSNTTEVLTKYFSSSSSYELWTEVDKKDTTYWRGYLNNTWIKEIDNTYNETEGTSSILEKGTYYLGYHTTGSYKTSVCSSVSSDVSVRECIENGTVVTNTSSDDYVGLLRVGEMFASQTRDYTYSSAKIIWLVTPYDSSNVRDVLNDGHLNNCYPSRNSLGARPSVNLKSTILIKSGSGTKADPFLVGLSSSE